MSDDDDVRAGEELARAWLQGKSELIDDLAALVDGMTRPLDATARAFLLTIGNAARLAPKSKVRQTPTGTPAPARLEAQTAAQPTPEAPPAAGLRCRRVPQAAARARAPRAVRGTRAAKCGAVLMSTCNHAGPIGVAIDD
jgi:hypothetical protein